MMTSNSDNKSSTLIIECDFALKADAETKYQHKVEMIRLILNGMSPTVLSCFCGESVSTLSSWVKSAKENGLESLHEKKRSGRDRKLKTEQLEQIYSILNEPPPSELDCETWTGSNLAKYIKKQYKIRLCTRQCQRIIKYHLEL